MMVELLTLANVGAGLFKLDAIESIWVRVVLPVLSQCFVTNAKAHICAADKFGKVRSEAFA